MVGDEVFRLVGDFGRLELEAVRREDWGELGKIREAEAEMLEGLGLSRCDIYGSKPSKPKPRRVRWPRWEEKFEGDEGDVLY